MKKFCKSLCVCAAFIFAAVFYFSACADEFYNVTYRTDGENITLIFDTKEDRFYEIHVSKNGGEFVLAGETESGQFEFQGESGCDYIFKISDYVVSEDSEGNAERVYDESVRETEVGTAPQTPIGGTAEYNSGKITFSWEAVKGADIYEIYRADGKNEPVYIGETADTSFKTDCDIFGEKCYFTVRACNKCGQEKIYSGFSETFSVITPPQKVSGLGLVKYNSSSMKVKWNASKGADGYAVYRRGPDTNSKYVFLGFTTATTYEVKGIPAGRLQKVNIYPYSIINGKKIYGENMVITRSAAPATPTLKQTSATTKSVKLSWNKVTCATAYRIYLYNSKTNKYELKDTVKGTSKTISGLSAGTSYKARIIAIREYDGRTYQSGTRTITVYTTPGKVTGTTVSSRTTTSYTFKWSKTKGASGYDIFRYNSKTKKYDKIKSSVTSTGYTVKSLSPGTVYYYRVKAYKTINGKKYYSDYSDKITCVTKLKATSSLKRENFINGVNLSWSKISGTQGYRIYVSQKKNGTYKCIKTIANAKTTSYKITGLTGGKTYYYKVAGYKKSDGKYYIGDTKLITVQPYKNHNFVKILNSYKSSKSLQVLNSKFKISESRKKAIMNIVNKYSRYHTTGFALVDIKSGAAIMYNANWYVPTASTAKAPYMMYVLSQQIDKGKGSLSEILTYQAKQKHGGSGIIQYSKIGTKYSIKTVIHNICKYSDNVGYYMLQDRFSYVGFNKWMKSLGNQTFINGKGIRWGKVSARDSAKIWSEIYKYFYTGKNGSFFKSELLASGYPNFRDILGGKYKIASKSGSTEVGWHDTGIVFKGDNPYILILLTNDNYLHPDYAFQKNLTLQLDALHTELVNYNNKK